ncbi:uncharacterized protein LOC106178199 [Lingula anatina]|uniref:Uncharacterized protein LOC106178199 n=1 Tax=Lingula anatina TaxID=7574 RepID=A0A1S3K2L4_LINAN|nr:uncharacterized protein LOC106178199 [Lingula anatina]|eukprot:XP_013416762.1 uncharacterized protein LOC106178199 [Lingula anatina]
MRMCDSFPAEAEAKPLKLPDIRGGHPSRDLTGTRSDSAQPVSKPLMGITCLQGMASTQDRASVDSRPCLPDLPHATQWGKLHTKHLYTHNDAKYSCDKESEELSLPPIFGHGIKHQKAENREERNKAKK